MVRPVKPLSEGAMIREAMARTYWSMIQGRQCPHCGAKMTTERRGCCTYAMPCGHKLYSGNRLTSSGTRPSASQSG